MKLKMRDRFRCKKLKSIHTIKAHPIFEVHAGGIEEWEHVKQLIE
jgi:hypothetical protein